MAQNETKFILLDKNHHPNGGLFQTSYLIDENMPWGMRYSKISLVPEIVSERIKRYPFSYEFVAQTILNDSQYDEY